MQSLPFPRYLVPLRSKYSPQHHISKQLQLPFLPQCQRPSFTPIKTTCKIIVLYILIFKFLDFLNHTVYIIRLRGHSHNTRTPLPFGFRTIVPSLCSSLDITVFFFRSVLLQNFYVVRHFVLHFG